MVEVQEKILAFDNQFHEFGTQTVEGTDCIVSPFPYIDPEQNKITLELTGTQIRELLSSIQIGAEWAYPDKSHQILFNFLKGMVCAPTLDPQGDCNEYPASAAFIHYFPDNPFREGDTAEGWNFEAWHRWYQFDTLFPDFVDDWLNGALNGLTQYQDNDVMFNISSLLAPNILAFLNDGGLLPRIEIKFNGTGHINVTLLSFPLGGKAVIELDQEPNVLDILTGGVLDPSAFMVELNRDIINFPPDEYPIVQIPIDVTTGGAHTLYINFIPVIDDASTPLLFGGGLRSIEMCGFTEQPTMGIEQIIWDGCELKSLTNGIETTIVTAAQIQDCLDLPVGGGGSLGAIGATYNKTIALTNFNTAAYAEIAGSNQAHTFTKTRALIGVNATILNANAAGNTFIKPVLVSHSNRYEGDNLTEFRALGTNGRDAWVWDFFDVPVTGFPYQLWIDGKTSGGQGSIAAGSDLEFVIIELDDASQIFVEDIRIFEGELQKKIAGVWIDVTDSFEAIIASLQAQVSTALANANSAIATNVTQQTSINSLVSVTNNHTTRLNSLEAFQEDAELDLAQHALSITDHENRIDALEAASGSLSDYLQFGVGSDEWVLTIDPNSAVPWQVIQGFHSSNGIASTFATPTFVEMLLSGVLLNQVTHVGIGLIPLTVGVPLDVTCYINGLSSNGLAARVQYPLWEAGEKILWMRNPNTEAGILRIEAFNNAGERFYLKSIKLLWRGNVIP